MIGAGKADGMVHQVLILRFVASVISQVAAAGELRDLLAYEFLLVVAIAQTFLHGGGIGGQGLQQIIRAQPIAVIGKTRIGFDQVVTVSLRGLTKQATYGQAGLTAARTHDDGRVTGIVRVDGRDLDDSTSR